MILAINSETPIYTSVTVFKTYVGDAFQNTVEYINYEFVFNQKYADVCWMKPLKFNILYVLLIFNYCPPTRVEKKIRAYY